MLSSTIASTHGTMGRGFKPPDLSPHHSPLFRPLVVGLTHTSQIAIMHTCGVTPTPCQLLSCRCGILERSKTCASTTCAVLRQRVLVSNHQGNNMRQSPFLVGNIARYTRYFVAAPLRFLNHPSWYQEGGNGEPALLHSLQLLASCGFALRSILKATAKRRAIPLMRVHPTPKQPTCPLKKRVPSIPTEVRSNHMNSSPLLPYCGVDYLWFAFVCFLRRSHPPAGPKVVATGCASNSALCMD